jgi:hypothetical protein
MSPGAITLLAAVSYALSTGNLLIAIVFLRGREEINHHSGQITT